MNASAIAIGQQTTMHPDRFGVGACPACGGHGWYDYTRHQTGENEYDDELHPCDLCGGNGMADAIDPADLVAWTLAKETAR